VHALLVGGAVAGLHRTIRSASVQAWTLALRDSQPGVPSARVRIETWGVSNADVGFDAASDVWDLDVDGATALLAGEGWPKRQVWMDELVQGRRVPRVLWNDHMLTMA
jgi:hypothetical protein